MKIEAPIPESKLPPAKKSGHFKHLAIYEAIMKLPVGKLLPITCETDEQAKKFAMALQHSSFATFRAYQREKVVYARLWNEKDDAERKHIQELRAKARLRKQPTGNTVASKS